ncbi:conserved hypothetical protein, partial [Ricinus communis]
LHIGRDSHDSRYSGFRLAKWPVDSNNKPHPNLTSAPDLLLNKKTSRAGLED